MQLQDFEYLIEGESLYDYSVKQTLSCARLLLGKAYICSVLTPLVGLQKMLWIFTVFKICMCCLSACRYD